MERVILCLAIIMFISLSCSDNNKVNNNNKEEFADAETEEIIEEDYEYEDENNNYDTENEDYGSNEDSLNKPPKIKTINIVSLSSNLRDGFKASIVSSDPDGDSVDYIYQWKINGEEIPGETEETLNWQDEFKRGDEITLEVIPYDDNAQGTWKSEGSFIIPNSPPKIISQPSGVVDDGNFSYKVEAEDLDGDTLTYSLKDAPSDMTISESTGEINWKFNKDNAGEYKVGIIVADNNGGESYQELNINVEANE